MISLHPTSKLSRRFPFCSPCRLQSQSAFASALRSHLKYLRLPLTLLSFPICFLRWYSLLYTITSDCIGLALKSQGVHDYIACHLCYQTLSENMTHPQQNLKEQDSSFTITQIAL